MNHPLRCGTIIALSRHVCTFFEAYWQDKFSKNVLPLRVGNDVATIDDVMRVIEILSSRREYTKLNPLVVLLGKGDHPITSSSTNQYGHEVATTIGITRSNVTFVGTGKDTTIVLGGFRIHNVENMTFKQMTVTNKSGDGINMSNAKSRII
jgi:pectate lyase